MKVVKDMSLIALGIGATLIYQRYSQDMMYCMENAMNKMAKCSAKKLDKLEDMM